LRLACNSFSQPELFRVPRPAAHPGYFLGENRMIRSNSNAQLKSIVERIERLEDEKAAIGSDIKDVYAEAKGNGYDPKVLRTIVRIRKQDAEKRAEQEAVLETYMHALGMLSDTPLGQAALRKAGGQVDLEEAIAARS
jgi:uncharacterized protein (UPF0335 family)